MNVTPFQNSFFSVLQAGEKFFVAPRSLVEDKTVKTGIPLLEVDYLAKREGEELVTYIPTDGILEGVSARTVLDVLS